MCFSYFCYLNSILALAELGVCNLFSVCEMCWIFVQRQESSKCAVAVSVCGLCFLWLNYNMYMWIWCFYVRLHGSSALHSHAWWKLRADNTNNNKTLKYTHCHTRRNDTIHSNGHTRKKQQQQLDSELEKEEEKRSRKKLCVVNYRTEWNRADVSLNSANTAAHRHIRIHSLDLSFSIASLCCTKTHTSI